MSSEREWDRRGSWEVGRLGVMWDEAVYSTSIENSTTIDLPGGKGEKLRFHLEHCLNLVIFARLIYRRATIALVTRLQLRTRHARVARDSNNHVMGLSGQANAGDDVSQPGLIGGSERASG